MDRETIAALQAEEAAMCREVRPGTLGYQVCLKPKGHPDEWHRSQNRGEWRTLTAEVSS